MNKSHMLSPTWCGNKLNDFVSENERTFCRGASCVDVALWDALSVVDLKALQQPEVLQQDGASRAHSLGRTRVVNGGTGVRGQKWGFFLA